MDLLSYLKLFRFILTPGGRSFRHERRFLLGRARGGQGPSCAYFSVHKAGSAWLARIFRDLALANGKIPVDLATLADQLNLFSADPNRVRRMLGAWMFQPEGQYLGCMRTYIELPPEGPSKKLLVLRDPRDVLVSLYFSIKLSHQLTNERLKRSRESTQAMTVDEFVLAQAPRFQARYCDYLLHALPDPAFTILYYEDMVTGFDQWFPRAAAALDLDRDRDAIGRVIESADFSVSSENPGAHKRQVMPGDHKRKLQAETIDKLNGIFREELTAFNYSN